MASQAPSPASQRPPPCGQCEDRAPRVAALQRRCAELTASLAREQERQEVQEREAAKEVQRLKEEHSASFGQMGTLLAEQRRVGGRWKEEMVELTASFEGRLQEASRRNRRLRKTVDTLKVGEDKSCTYPALSLGLLMPQYCRWR